MTITPKSRPQQSEEKSRSILGAVGDLGSAPVILGMRGYFLDSMGKPGANDRGIYDDAIFVVAPGIHKSFWGNTDPSRYRKGHGTSESTKGMASLIPGVYAYKPGMHRGSYMALVQAEPVVVSRDGSPDYLDRGWFGINIHRGGWNTTSSLGCQTIHPSQWDEFYAMVRKVMDDYDQETIMYCLVEAQG